MVHFFFRKRLLLFRKLVSLSNFVLTGTIHFVCGQQILGRGSYYDDGLNCWMATPYAIFFSIVRIAK
jgi:hypothetical protein